jgi:hypothetical protein
VHRPLQFPGRLIKPRQNSASQQKRLYMKHPLAKPVDVCFADIIFVPADM